MYSNPHSLDFSHQVSIEDSATFFPPNDKKERRINIRLLFPIITIILILIKLQGLIKDSSVIDNGTDSEIQSPSSTPFHEHPVLRPLVISGPSGVGKGTLINMLVEFYNQEVETNEFFNHEDHHPLSFSVSHTTRGPRPGEKDGVHYHFTAKEEMLKDIKDNKFIEHAEVHGNIYGTSYSSVTDVISKGRICILDIDVQGARRIKEDTTIIAPHFIFIAPPSMEILEKRLRDRGTETEENIQKRTANAQNELNYGLGRGNFHDIVINDDLNKAFLHLRLILEEWYPHLNQVPSSTVEL